MNLAIVVNESKVMLVFILQLLDCHFCCIDYRFIVEVPYVSTLNSHPNRIFAHHTSYHLCLVLVWNQKVNCTTKATFWALNGNCRHAGVKY